MNPEEQSLSIEVVITEDSLGDTGSVEPENIPALLDRLAVAYDEAIRAAYPNAIVSVAVGAEASSTLVYPDPSGVILDDVAVTCYNAAFGKL